VPTRILVVEDDPGLCEFIREVLSSAGLDAVATTDSVQAAARLKTEKFNAFFLDLRMPAPDGIELARQIRSSALNRVVPVIMITGETERGLMARAFQVGVNYFLFKPVDRTKLMRLVRVTQDSIEQERRRFQRLKVVCRVSMVAGSDRLEGKTLDLSSMGMLVQTGRPLSVGTPLKIAIEPSPGAAPIRASARVVRVVGQDCAGLEIQDMNAEDVYRWHEFLLPPDIPRKEEAQTGRTEAKRVS
jgi:two-component system, chemotaxis family, chemotaxis protein CheY